jgi:transposase-like protein
MGRKVDRDVTASLKGRAALAALRGDRTTAELAAQFDLDPDQIEQWKREFEGQAEAVFSQPSAPPPPARSPTLPQAQMLDDDKFWGEETLPTSGVSLRKNVAATAPTVTSPLLPRDGSWPRKLLAPLLVGWRERHHAAKTARELLKPYDKVAARHPTLKKRDLYRFVVVARAGVTLADADAILARATESFATWPVERALTFRDVVHYLAVSDYLASNVDAAAWTRESFGRVVASLVPDNL